MARKDLLLTIKNFLLLDEDGLEVANKVLILPYNDQNQILIQDRTGFKSSSWGYFGGSIEKGESALDAVIRETMEELTIQIASKDLMYFGEFTEVYKGIKIICQCFLWKMDVSVDDLTLREGRDMEFVAIK